MASIDDLLALLKAKEADSATAAKEKAITKSAYLKLVTDTHKMTFMHIAFFNAIDVCDDPEEGVAQALEQQKEMFDMLLQDCAVVITPGVGFGSQGEGFVRFSCFASHESVKEAAGE